jgi:hypothetical protein
MRGTASSRRSSGTAYVPQNARYGGGNAKRARYGMAHRGGEAVPLRGEGGQRCGTGVMQVAAVRRQEERARAGAGSGAVANSKAGGGSGGAARQQGPCRQAAGACSVACVCEGMRSGRRTVQPTKEHVRERAERRHRGAHDQAERQAGRQAENIQAQAHTARGFQNRRISHAPHQEHRIQPALCAPQWPEVQQR